MRVAITEHVQAPTPTNVTCTWSEVVGLFRAEAKIVRGKTKEDQRMISFGAFTGAVGNSTVDPEGLWAVALDFDDVPDAAFRAAVELAQTLSTEGLAHTTWSHGTGALDTTRGRIVIPFDVAIRPENWEATWGAFAVTFAIHAGAEVDPVCKNVGRRYWLPSINERAAPPFDKGPWIIAWGS